MDQLTHARDMIETLMSNGGISEGDYLALMNDFKKVYDAIPRAPEVPPQPVAIHINPLIADAVRAYPDARMAVMRYLNVPAKVIDVYDTHGVHMMVALDTYANHRTPENRAALATALSSAAITVEYIMRAHHEYPDMPLWVDRWADLGNDVMSIPGWRNAAVGYAISRKKESAHFTEFLFKYSNFDEALMRLCDHLCLPIFFRQRLHYNKVVDTNLTKLHRLRVRMNIGREAEDMFQFECWTNRIQFGRTFITSFGRLMIAIARYQYVNGTNPDYDYVKMKNFVKVLSHYTFETVFQLAVSGITARTRDKNRIYYAPGMDITYIDAVNAPGTV